MRRANKPHTLTRAVDALIGVEEQNGKQKKEEKERNRGRDSILATLVASYDPHGSFGRPILSLLLRSKPSRQHMKNTENRRKEKVVGFS